jgi:hypothetical protein
MSQIAHFISMLASLLSFKILSTPLSVGYLIYDNTGFVEQDYKFQKQEMIDVSEQVTERLKHSGIR